MKKILSIIIIAAVLALSIIPVFAETKTVPTQNQSSDSFKAALKTQWDELKSLKQVTKDLKSQIKSERETIKNLLKSKKQTNDQKAIKAARIFDLNNIEPKKVEIKFLKAQKAKEWLNFKKAKENNDIKGAKTALQNVINLKKKINTDLNQILSNMKQMESILK